jgi:6-phosphogluconolactonase (cycloisomerase 2 family)
MKRLIGYTAALCLLAIMVGCGGVTSTGTLAYVSNSTGTGFSVYTVNTDGTLTQSSISPQDTPTGPMVLKFTANGKWAYFLDTGGNLYGYTRTGDGSLQTLIDTYPVGASASSLVISPNSTFIYVALPNPSNPSLAQLATYSIDQSTGILTQVGSNAYPGYSLTQLVINSAGSLLYGLSPSQAAVVPFSLSASSGVATQGTPQSVGIDPIYMVLSVNSSFLYVLDHTGTTAVQFSSNGTPTAYSPNIFGFNIGTTGALTAMPGSPFNENPDATTSIYPTNPIAGATTNDSRYLYVANQGSHNISIYKINSTSGVLTEVLNTTTLVNGVSVTSGSPFDCGTGCTTPSFVAVSSANNAMYLLDESAGKLFQFKINQNTGQLRAQSPAIPTGSALSNPTWITIR